MQLSLGKRIGLLISLPLTAYTIVAAVSLWGAWREFRELRQVKLYTEAFSSSLQLQEALQAERETSAMFFYGKVSDAELTGARQLVDNGIREFNSAVAVAKVPAADLEKAQAAVLDLANFRKWVDAKERAGEMLDGYNAAVSSFLAYQVKFANVVSSIDGNTALLSLTLIGSARESAAQLRATLFTVLLANAPMSPVVLTKVEKLRSGIQFNLESPLLLTTEATKKKLTDFQDGDHWKLILMIYGTMISKAGMGRYGLDPDAVYKAWSTVVESFSAPEHDELTYVKEQISNRVSAMRQQFLLIMGLLFTCLAVVGYLTRRFAYRLSDALAGIAENLLNGAEKVAGATRDVAHSSNELSRETSQQATALQSTASSLEEINAMVTKNAENAKRSREQSEQSGQLAADGRKSLGDMGSAITRIQKSNEEILQQMEAGNQEISGIVKVINDIADKTKVINDIVFQTKLLSFNASVEAARAGEHGKGFAVVAEEVGRLAHMSGQSAKEISDILAESTAKVETIISGTRERVRTLMEASGRIIEEGTSTVSRSSDVFDKLLKSVEEVNLMVQEISTASEEQAQGVKSINSSVYQLDKSTQTSVGVAQKTASISQELATHADDLRSGVDDLLATVQGHHGRHTAAPSAATQKTPPASSSNHGAKAA